MSFSFIDELFNLSFIEAVHEFASFRSNIWLSIGVEDALDVYL